MRSHSRISQLMYRRKTSSDIEWAQFHVRQRGPLIAADAKIIERCWQTGTRDQLTRLVERRGCDLKIAFWTVVCRLMTTVPSLKHILASPGYAPGIIAVNVTRLERGFNASPHIPSIFNHFWDIAIYRWRVIDFQQSPEVNEHFYVRQLCWST